MEIESRTVDIRIGGDGVIHLPGDCVREMRLAPEDRWTVSWGPQLDTLLLIRDTVKCCVCGKVSADPDSMVRYGRAHFCDACRENVKRNI